MQVGAATALHATVPAPAALHTADAKVLMVYPTVHWYVAVTGFAALYVNGTLEYSTYPFAGAASPGQTAALHVGVAVLDHAPLAPHVTISATPGASVKPSLHVYVSTVS